jgi:streptogramin lyase
MNQRELKAQMSGSNIINMFRPSLTRKLIQGALLLLLTVFTAVPVVRGAVATANILEFIIPVPLTEPGHITYGPDGAYWFTEFDDKSIGRVTTGGYITSYVIPSYNAQPYGIVAGPDHNLWFTESQPNKIGRLTPAGVFTEFTIPTTNNLPAGITVGPDKRLWFAELNTGKVGVIPTTATSGAAIKQYTVSTNPNCLLYNIVTGPDGNLWITDSGLGRIWTISTNGANLKFFQLAANSKPLDITSDITNNALWFTEYGSNKIGRLDVAAFNSSGSNVLKEFTLPRSSIIGITNSHPYGITMGPDGHPWFTEYLGGNLGHITNKFSTNTTFTTNITVTVTNNVSFTNSFTTTNVVITPTNFVISEFFLPTTNAVPTYITSGGDGRLWFSEFSANKIGRYTFPPAPPSPPAAPQIAIAFGKPSQIIISWPTNATGFQLQARSSMSGAVWSNVTNSPGVVGGRFTVTNSATGDSFYRLKK